MDISILVSKQKNLLLQRNVLIGVSTLALLSNVILGVCLLTTEKQTLVIPAHFDKELLLSNKRLPISYLEEMTVFYLDLLLGLTEGNIDYKAKLILRHVHPSFYIHISKFLAGEIKRYKEYRLSTQFKVSELKIDDQNLIAQAKGVLISYFGSNGKSETLVSYQIKYDYSGGILTIKDFSIIKEEKGAKDE
jgi:type IV conjugative transfer system protein TraE